MFFLNSANITPFYLLYLQPYTLTMDIQQTSDQGFTKVLRHCPYVKNIWEMEEFLILEKTSAYLHMSR